MFSHPSHKDAKKLFQERLHEIHQVSKSILADLHWCIVISPLMHNANSFYLIPDLNQLIEASKVKIERSSYPRLVGKDNPDKESNWIGIQTNLERHEYWRLYRDGQFINISGTWPNSSKIIPDKEILYTVASAFKFAENILKEEVYAEGINIEISLNNVQNFGLKLVSDLNDLPSQYHKAADNSYQKIWTIQKNDLSSSLDVKACKAIIWFIECFGCETVSVDTINERRKKLLDSL